MLRSTYLIRNLLRKPLRSVLTVIAVAIPVCVYMIAMAIVRNVEVYLDESVRQMRLAVVQKTSIVNPLPVGHRAKIEALDPTGTRIVSVCGMRWFGGRVPGAQSEVYFIAVDADTFPTTYPEMELTAGQQEQWLRDKRAAVVGRSPAAHYGWKVGDRITVEATVPPFLPMEMNVIAIPRNTADSETSFFRYDYLNEVLRTGNWLADRYSFLFVKCGSRADLVHFRDQIDAAFSGTPDETKTQDEKTFMESFIAAQFDLPTKLRQLSYVVVAVAIMAAANTMMMSFRDRFNEYAVFKSLGFPAAAVALPLFVESLMLSVLGGVFGAGGPYVAFNWTPLRDWRIPQLGNLIIRENLVVEGLVVTLLVGLLAAAIPAARAARVRVVDALRRVG